MRLPLTFIALMSFQTMPAPAQEEPTWKTDTFRLVAGDLEIPPKTSARAEVGPFGFDFFCHAYGTRNENLMLAVTPNPNLGGRWRATYLAGGFDGSVDIRAGTDAVGQVGSFSESATGRVMVTLPADQYDLTTLISGQRLTFDFLGNAANPLPPFTLSVEGDNLGPSLCSALSGCGADAPDICAAFMTIEGGNSFARALNDPETSDGAPRWHKSEFQPPEAIFPYYRTATIKDPETETELHLSCLAREGKTLAVHFMQTGQDAPAPFTDIAGGRGDGDLIWETKGLTGRIGNMTPIAQGAGLEFGAWTDTLITRATLETMMTTDDSIRVQARLDGQSIAAEFSSAGSRDAICAVMKGCDVPLNMSPACVSR